MALQLQQCSKQMCMDFIPTTPTVHLHLLNEGTVKSTMFMLVASIT